MADDRMRAEFEAHALMSCEPIDMVRDVKGEYVWVWALESWALWQAACRAQAKRDAEICEERARDHEHPVIKAAATLCSGAIREDTGL